MGFARIHPLVFIKEAARRQETIDSGAEVEYKPLSTGSNGALEKGAKMHKVTIIENVCRKEFGLLAFVWVSLIAAQIAKQNYTLHVQQRIGSYTVLLILQRKRGIDTKIKAIERENKNII
ncbi:hypothetical protein MTR_3g110018 [Medicago truncatula]|uniref:Uncharacterized protein n=1 Tax=Medicago truncatula TaxID=3880 RepID=A0A072V3R4_MEDTR|nr:hypothetical protein MTR_3g110018 [Medicago truncatula]